jgi:hypothetical protein
MQKCFRVATLRHGFLQPEAHLFSEFLDLDRGVVIAHGYFLVFHWNNLSLRSSESGSRSTPVHRKVRFRISKVINC